MSLGTVKVLLAGERANGFSLLLQYLERRGYECRVAASSSEAMRLCAAYAFDVVLCTDQMEEFHLLIAALAGSTATLYRCYLVEDGCWWVPAIRHGEKCLGAAALRSTEFSIALDRIVDEVKSCQGSSREFAS